VVNPLLNLRLQNDPLYTTPTGNHPMLQTLSASSTAKSTCSELVLSDRLISLAQDADRAGYTDTAGRLLTLACSVFDEAPKKPH
jgi:hypothetical protein